MNTSYAWMKTYVPGLHVSAQEFTDAMTLSGSKVEGYEAMDADLEKIVVLHDYLVLHTEYDFDGYTSGNLSEDSFSAYGVFVKKKAVCSGYMLAYHYLLKKCGITDYYVTSTSMNHAWNVVKLGKNYYHVDTTWDDVVLLTP